MEDGDLGSMLVNAQQRVVLDYKNKIVYVLHQPMVVNHVLLSLVNNFFPVIEEVAQVRICFKF